ncbi:MAG: GNAT family N-acetyltransferase [Ruminococcus sp.]|nr:GNAT family N-acetyltransferase [Ruminococcus sp.]
MEIFCYQEKYKNAVIDLILHIQNEEYKIDLTLDEQPDLMDIVSFYQKGGGEFWVAINDGEIIGTIAFMNYGDSNAVLKKFFVRSDYRGKGIGLALYLNAYNYLVEHNYHKILLDTPSIAKDSHHFYQKAGFKRITACDLPFHYEYPDRDSYLFLLNLDSSD